MAWMLRDERPQASLGGIGCARKGLSSAFAVAIPLKQPFSTGYKITRSITPVEQKTVGVWSRGDVYRVRLDIDAQSDMTWVVVHDPIPAGSAILGTGLGRDSQLFTRGEKKQGWAWHLDHCQSQVVYGPIQRFNRREGQ